MPALHQKTCPLKAGLGSLGQNIKMFQPKYWSVMQEQTQVDKI